MTEVRSRLSDARRDLELLGEPRQRDVSQEADRILRLVRIRAAEARLSLLEQEQQHRQPMLALLRARQEWLRRQEGKAAARLENLELRAVQQRQNLAAQSRLSAELARHALSDMAPQIQMLAQDVANLSSKLQEVTSELEEVRAARREADRKLSELTQKSEKIRALLSRAAASRAFAQILLEERRNLPLSGSLRERIAGRRVEISSTRAESYLLEQLPPETDVASLDEELRENPAVTGLLEQRVNLLGQLQEGYASLNAGRLELSTIELAYMSEIKEFRELLAGRLFWLPSSPPLGGRIFQDAFVSAAALSQPKNGRELFTALGEIFHRLPYLSFPVMLSFLILLGLRRRTIRRLEDLGMEIRKVSKDRWSKTGAALLLTGMLALPVPALLGYLAWELPRAVDASRFIHAVATGLAWSCPILFSFFFLLEVSRQGGLGERHFGWGRGTVMVLRRQLPWWALGYVPLLFLVTVLVELGQSVAIDSLGRILFAGAMIWTALILRKLLHPETGVASGYFKAHPEGWIRMLRGVWYPAAVLSPLALALLAAGGYFLTAFSINHRLQFTAFLVAAGPIAYGLALRAFSIHERRVALERMIEERRLRKAGGVETENAGDAAGADPDDAEINLEAVGEQTRHLLRFLVTVAVGVGVWFAWAGLAPAVVSEPENGTLGRIGLVQILGAALAVLITFVTARDLPGILELVVLRNLPLDAGSRSAIKTLLSYAMIATGLALTFQILEVDWSKFGWIAAALSVGLGFGLQEVVANFVCGIILLFERPLRQGDVVTVGDVTGVVSRLRIRATTITTLDRKELIVPNKEFITGKLMNWTLSNPMNRIVIPVGIAYGSDIEKARNILLQVARDHPRITEEPVPTATLEEFGDSSLNLMLR